MIPKNQINTETIRKLEMRQLLTANFFSVLFYNSKIWHTPSLNVQLKEQLLAASASAMRVLENKHDLSISYASNVNRAGLRISFQ